MSLSSSQWQHEQQGGAVVLLWGSGAGGHDPRTDLLPEEILWSAESRIKILSVFHNINTSSLWFNSYTNWMSNSAEMGRTWLFASPPICVLVFICPSCRSLHCLFGKGCDFELLIRWVCLSPDFIEQSSFYFFARCFFFNTVTIAQYYENDVKVMMWYCPNTRTWFRIVWNKSIGWTMLWVDVKSAVVRSTFHVIFTAHYHI